MDARKIKWKGITGGGSIGQRGLILLFKYLDIRIGYAILFFVVPFYFIFAKKRAEYIYTYFRRHQHYTRLKAGWKTYLNHFYFGQVVLDRFAIFAGQRHHYSIEITGQEYWDAANAEEKGCIVISSHVGNFEIAGYLLHWQGKKINGIVFGQEAKVMQRYRNQMLNGHNVNMIPVTEDLSHIFFINNALQNGEMVSMPSDRIFSGNKMTEIEFLGTKAFFPTGAFHLALSKKANLLTCFVMRESSRQYHIYIHPLKSTPTLQNKTDKINSLAKDYVAELEKILQLYPEQWYNFYDFWNEEK